MRRCVRLPVQLLPPQLWGAEPQGRSWRAAGAARAGKLVGTALLGTARSRACGAGVQGCFLLAHPPLVYLYVFKP